MEAGRVCCARHYLQCIIIVFVRFAVRAKSVDSDES